MNKSELIIHIGYPKTGTTTLQTGLFSKHYEINYLNPNNNVAKIISDIYYRRENGIKRNLNCYRKELYQILVKQSSGCNLISSESFLSFSMFFRLNPAPYIHTLEPNSVARKMKMIFKDLGVFENVKILITLRKQTDLIKSMYAQVYNLSYKRYQETSTFEKFLKYTFDENKDDFIMDVLQYNEIVELYSDLFGDENVKVLVFEDFKNKQSEFLLSMADFIKIDYDECISLIKGQHKNARSTTNGLYPTDARSMYSILGYYKQKYFKNVSISRIRPILKSVLDFKIKSRTLNVSLSEEQEDYYMEFFKKGNKEIDERLNLGLKNYDYY